MSLEAISGAARAVSKEIVTVGKKHPTIAIAVSTIVTTAAVIGGSAGTVVAATSTAAVAIGTSAAIEVAKRRNRCLPNPEDIELS